MKKIHDKKFIIVLCVLVVLTLVSAGALGLTLYGKNHHDSKIGQFFIDRRGTQQGISFAQVMEQSEKSDITLPLQATDFENIYYTLAPDGTVTFYQWQDGAVKPYDGKVKTVNVKPVCTYQVLPVTVSYIEKDGHRCGYGLFTNEKHPDVSLYGYAFCKLSDLPKGYGEGDALLTLDFEKENYAKAKLYTEAFRVTLASGETNRVVTNHGRTIDENATMRRDWFFATDSSLASLGDTKYFLSGRNYMLGEFGKKTDLLTVNGTEKPKVAVTGCLGTYCAKIDKGVVYLKQTEKGFDRMLWDGKETVLQSFTGDYFDDYFLQDNFLIRKSDFSVTDLRTGKEKKLKATVTGGETFTFFALSPDGSHAVAAKGGNTLYVLDYTKGKAALYADAAHSEQNPIFTWLDGNHFYFLRQTNGKPEGFLVKV